MVFLKNALMCIKKVKLINNDCLPILMPLHIMLACLMLFAAYLILFVCIMLFLIFFLQMLLFMLCLGLLVYYFYI